MGYGSIESKGLERFIAVRNLYVSGNLLTSGSIQMGSSIADGDSDLILSSSVTSQVTISGNLKVTGDICVTGSGMFVDVTGSDNFHVKGILSASGIITNASGNLILSSSNSTVSLSSSLQFVNIVPISGAHINSINSSLIFSSTFDSSCSFSCSYVKIGENRYAKNTTLRVEVGNDNVGSIEILRRRE